jgi:UDP-3-O-[3-hydroxymyristoyl] N-acetylglucosamine deacetylase/3-hydroxyacyl-[acyl-carrier-protein] dehydratase
MALQQSIGKPVSINGVGLVTGVNTKLTFNPAPEHYGISFVRTDLDNKPEIKADIDFVTEFSNGINLGKDGVNILSIEHLMSAFAGMKIDNCRIEIDAPEIPFLDGSALPYAELIKEAGIVEQKAQREFLTIDQPVIHVDGEAALSVFPLDDFRLTLEIDYKHPVLGAQYTTLFSLNDFEKEFAPARTFSFLSEVEKLLEQGNLKGATPDCAIIVQDFDLTDDRIERLRRLFAWNGPIESGKNGLLNNTELRFQNEPCRHKALDIIGDLYLLGKPVKAHIIGARTGHPANITIVKKLREYFNLNNRIKEGTSVQIDYNGILNTIPHRYPFLLVDKVLEIVPGKRIIAQKNVSFNENFFTGHFPENPVMPGVLQIEALAQACTIMGLFGKADSQKKVLFLGIDNARFRGMVRPGDTLRLEVKTLQFRRGAGKFEGKAYVDDKLVCETEMLAMLG